MAKPVKFLRVDIEDIKPYENNAKIHSDDQIDRLAKSISEFGFVSPCLIDKDNNLIAGHGRLLAAKKNGLKVIPCVYVEGLTEEPKSYFNEAMRKADREYDKKLAAKEKEANQQKTGKK